MLPQWQNTEERKSMSRISKAFENKAFIGFLTAGDPDISSSEKFIMEMIRAGADLIEIGIPFSDPIAEGPVIQEATMRALKSGTTLDKVFSLVESLRAKTDVPLVFLTYLNPVFNCGYDIFFEKCQKSGLDGIIIPDLPYEEKEEVQNSADKFSIELISLVAPTSKERISKIAADSKGFIYVVSSMGVTGVRKEIKTDLDSIVKVVKESTDTPCAIGFGISTPEQAKKFSKISDGVIVGSAIVKIIARYGSDAAPYIYDYVKSMKDAVR